MNFTSGFKKEAAIPGALGKGLGKAVGGVKAGVKAVTTGIAERGQEFKSGFRAGSQPQKAPVGQRAGEAAVKAKAKSKGSPLSQEESQKIMGGKPKEVGQRLKGYRAAVEKAKPSFARKHPIVTGIGVLGAYKALTSQPQESQQAQVYQPSY